MDKRFESAIVTDFVNSTAYNVLNEVKQDVQGFTIID